MLHNQLLLLFRNIWRNKTFSFLNIFGLAVGIACASLIFLWVEHELSFNHNFKKRNVIFSIKQTTVGENPTIVDCPIPMAADIKNTIPGIRNIARLNWERKQLFVLGDRSFNESGQYADSSILSILDFTFIYGTNPSLQSPESIIISETMSRALFGKDNPVYVMNYKIRICRKCGCPGLSHCIYTLHQTNIPGMANLQTTLLRYMICV
jgi:hypothetical protein